jgi:hypothetical protein
MGKRNPGHIDMGLCMGRSLRHHDVRVDIDGGRTRSPGASVGVVNAGRGSAVAVLAINHVSTRFFLL